MSIQYPLQEENELIIESEQLLVAQGIIGEDQHPVYVEASPQDLSWLPTEDQ
jgi:hypothetical protein